VVGIELDYEAIGEILRVACRRPVNALGRAVAEAAGGDANLPDNATVTSRGFTTDRAVAVVRLNHPEGVALQAKYGILTRAASANGLEVVEKNE